MTDKQRKLIEKAKRSAVAAEMLMRANDTDFAVSRAYYAMFYTAEALLLEKGLTFSKHSAVVASFGQHFAATGEVPAEYHRYLMDAQEDRNASDYLTEDRIPMERSQEHIARARMFIAAIERMLLQRS